MANSYHLPPWKGKPISCPHDVSIIIWLSLLVVTGQGLTPRGPLLNSPCLLAWFTAHNDGYTEDYFTYDHTMAGTSPTLYPALAAYKWLWLCVSDYISCPSDCQVTSRVAAALIFCLVEHKSHVKSTHQRKANRLSCSYTRFFLVMYFNKKAEEMLWRAGVNVILL